MSGLSGTQLALRSERLVLQQNHNEALESRKVSVVFGMPYEVLFGVICHSVHNAERAATFFVRLADIDERAVRDYLLGFVTRMVTELDLQSCDLEVKTPFRNSPMDFPRPSPTRNFVMPAFFSPIASSGRLQDVIAAWPMAF